MDQQLWGYKVEEKIYLGVRERKKLNIIALEDSSKSILQNVKASTADGNVQKYQSRLLQNTGLTIK